MSPPEKRSPRTGGTAEGSENNSTSSQDSTTAALLDAWARHSRFNSSVIVVSPGAPEARTVARAIRSREGRARLREAQRIRAHFLVLAGQLHRAKGGTFAAHVLTDERGALEAATAVAFDKLTAWGENQSAWFIATSEPARGRVLETLAGLAATEGAA